jgi:hypothetical protein
VTCTCSTADNRLDWPHEVDCALMAPAPLDEERLERALHVVDDEVQFMHRDAAQHRDVIARRIAAAYADDRV